MDKKTALIGYTGFVGGNLVEQISFTDLYNSKNISEIKGQDYDLVVCAGARAEKWKINQDPQPDLENINLLISALSSAEIKKLILISTIDVYPKPIGVDEDTPIDPSQNHPYGKHRLMLERACAQRFDTLVVRLPGLFGSGLKKNVIFDLLHNNMLEKIHADSVYQFYGLVHLWKDLQTALQNNLKLANFATEPVSVREVAKHAFDLGFENCPADIKPAFYDMRTKYFELYDGKDGYIWDKSKVLDEIREFVVSYPKENETCNL